MSLVLCIARYSTKMQVLKRIAILQSYWLVYPYLHLHTRKKNGVFFSSSIKSKPFWKTNTLLQHAKCHNKIYVIRYGTKIRDSKRVFKTSKIWRKRHTQPQKQLNKIANEKTHQTAHIVSHFFFYANGLKIRLDIGKMYKTRKGFVVGVTDITVPEHVT